VNAGEQQAWLADSSFGSSRQGHKDNPTSFELGCQVITLCACSSSVGLTIPRYAKKLFGVGETLRRDDLADRAVFADVNAGSSWDDSDFGQIRAEDKLRIGGVHASDRHGQFWARP